ncbi:hypothetical protein Tco_1390464 [Tanacetum coccineum]
MRNNHPNPDTMADAEHAPAMAPPVRTDEQILPRIRWVPIGKSNCYLNEEKSQPNPIYKIAVDILKQTNFFRAFTASSTIPAIYIQQFWDTICFDSKIMPVDNNWAFSPPPTPDTLVEFVNKLGYLKEVIHLSNVTTNDMFQPWRALTTIINLCLTGKTSGFERPRAPVLQILWGVVNRAHIDYAERMFTKLIIFHLQRLHNFYPRPESPLHLPTEEPVLGNLKFSVKGTKREVFGMTISNELINDVIRGSDYYDAYLEKVAKHQRHLASKEVSGPESPAPKPAKPTKQAKPKTTKQPTISKTTAKKPKPAPAKPQEKKRKPVSESSEAPPLAKRAKAGKVVKKRTDKSSKQLIYEFVDEGVPAKEVPRKGKEKVGEEQAAQVLLHLQTPKKKSPAEQYIFQRHTPVPSELAGHEETSSLYAELGLSGSDTESDKEMPSVAGPNPDDVAESQPLPTPSVLAGPNLEHSDVEITDASSQPQPEHMDEGFIATAYPEVQENLKLTVDEQMILEEPVSSTGTLSSLQHLTKDFSYGDQFIDDKPSKANNEKTTTTTLPLPPQLQKGPSDPIIIKRMGELKELISNLVEENQALKARLDKQGSRINKLETMDLPKMIKEQTVEFIDS